MRGRLGPAAARTWTGLAAGVVLLFPGLARADNLEEFGLTPRAQGMGMAYTALASDASAAHYNPGGLTLSRHVNVTLAYSFAQYALRFDSDSGGDLDDDAERIPDLSAITLGMSTTIPLDCPDRIGFGLALHLPTRGIVDLKANAPTSEPEWFRYGERHDRIHVITSLGVKATEWLRLGLGASIFVDGEGGTVISAGLATPVQPSYELQLKPDAGIVAGFLLLPLEWLSFGVTYRSEVSFKLDFEANAQVSGIGLPLTLEAISLFTPHQVQLGFAFDLGERVLLTFDFLWANWSAYRDPHLVVTSAVVAVPNRVREDFNDVYSPRLGVELAATDWLFFRGGYAWRNAIVDDQDGLTNLVDSAKHIFTVGVGFSFGKPSERITEAAKEKEGAPAQNFEELSRDASFDIDLFAQVHWHQRQDQDKPAGDPVGDWEADGLIFNFGLGLTARF